MLLSKAMQKPKTRYILMGGVAYPTILTVYKAAIYDVYTEQVCPTQNILTNKYLINTAKIYVAY